MHDPDPNWRVIRRSDNLRELRSIVTSLQAMEFDARLVASDGSLVGMEVDASDERKPFLLEVPTDQADAVRPMVDEIILEQEQFDELVVEKTTRFERRMWLVLLLLAIVVTTIYLISRSMNPTTE